MNPENINGFPPSPPPPGKDENIDKKLIEEIEHIDDKETLNNFVEKSFLAGNETGELKDKGMLTAAASHALLKKYFELAKKSDGFAKGMLIGTNTITLLNLMQGREPLEEGKENLTDTVFRDYLDMAAKYPDEATALWQFFWQTHGETAKPETYVNALANSLWRPELRELRSRIYGELSYNLSFNSQDRYATAFEKNLDFDNPDTYFKTGVLLDILQRVFDNSDSYTKNHGVPEFVRRVLEKKTAEKSGSYLLNVRAEEMLVAGERGRMHIREVPFEITAGKMAVVGDQEILLKDSNDASRRVLSPGDLFLSTKISEEEKKKLLYDYAYIMKKPVRDRLHAEFNITFSELSIPEQFQFLMFLKQKKSSEVEPIRELGRRFGTPAFRTFLSLEQGGTELGDKILILAEKLPKESAGLLFKKYGEIADEVNSVSGYLHSSLGEKATPGLVEQVKEQLLGKGKEMLAYYANHAETCAAQECADLGRELEARLKDLKTSVVLLASAVKALVAEGEFDLQDLKDIEVSYDEHELEEKDKESIRRMSEENTKQYPQKLRDYWRGTAEAALKHPAPGETFISVKHQGEIVAVMRVVPREDGTLYGASFNVNPNIRGSRIGTELLREVIEKYSARKDFLADVYEKNPMLETYTSKFGFEVVGSTENYHDTGTTVLQIVKRKENRE